MQIALLLKNLDVYVLLKSYLIFPIMTGSIDSQLKGTLLSVSNEIKNHWFKRNSTQMTLKQNKAKFRLIYKLNERKNL